MTDKTLQTSSAGGSRQFNRPPGSVITFYSYKGGTGRSMSLANVAWILASAGNRVLAIDWDLEAPGLHRYFAPFLRDNKLVATEGIIDFADEYRTRAMTPPTDGQTLADDWYLAHADLSHYAVRLEWDFDNGGYLDFVPAGRQDENYSGLVNSFNWKTFFTDLGGNRLLDATKDNLRNDYDYVLIDSRTGVSDTSGICTVKMPDILVVCFTLNNQGIEGAASVASSVYTQRGGAVKIFPIPMRLDNAEKEKLDARLEECKKQFFEFPNDAEFSKKQYWNDVPVQYVAYYAYEEVLAAFGEKDTKIISLLASAERLTSYLTNGKVAKLTPPSEEMRLKTLAEYAGRVTEVTTAEQLSAAAQAAFARFSAERQADARRVLLRLVRVPRPEEKAEPTRKRVVVRNMGAGAAPVVRQLLDAQLIHIVSEDEKGEATVEIINDELLRDWKELRKWIAEDEKFLIWRQQLRADMVEWKESGRRRDELLKGADLVEARRWLRRSADLNDEETEFIRASIAAVNRTRLYATAVAAILLIAIAVFGYRLWLKSRDVAAANSLALQAQKHVSQGLRMSESKDVDELQLGALLALESQRIASSTEATNILNKAMAALPRRPISLKSGNPVTNAVWSRDGKYITTISGNVWRKQDNKVVLDTRVVRMREISTGNDVAASGDLAFGRIGFNTGVQNFGISPDGRYVAFSRATKSGNNVGPFAIEILDVLKGDRRAVGMHANPVNAFVFSPDSRLMLKLGKYSAVLVDVESAKVLKTLRGQKGIAITGAFSPDGKFIATVSDDFFARIWNVFDPEQAPPVEINIGGVASKLLFTDDGQYLVTLLGLTGSKFAQVWDWARDREVRFVHGTIIRDVAISNDGKYIATSGEDQEVLVWDTSKTPFALLASGALSPNYFEKKDSVADILIRNVDKIAFGPAPADYLAGIGNSMAFVWKPPDFGNAVLLSHDDKINDLGFGPGGMIATASSDQYVRIWAIGDEQGGQPCQHLTRNLTTAEWDQYLPNRSYHRTCPEIARPTP